MLPRLHFTLVLAQVDAALKGDTSAAKFCERRAGHEDGKGKTSVVSNLSLEELLRSSTGSALDWPTRAIEQSLKYRDGSAGTTAPVTAEVDTNS